MAKEVCLQIMDMQGSVPMEILPSIFNRISQPGPLQIFYNFTKVFDPNKVELNEVVKISNFV